MIDKKVNFGIIIFLVILQIALEVNGLLELKYLEDYLNISSDEARTVLIVPIFGIISFLIIVNLYSFQETLLSQRESLLKEVGINNKKMLEGTLRENREEVNSLTDKILNSIYATDVESIDSSEQWYAKAIEILENYTSYSNTRNIYAISTFVFTNEDDVMAGDRRRYIDTISKIILRDNLTYDLIIVPGISENRDGNKVISAELKARIESLNILSKEEAYNNWSNNHMNIHIAAISGIDMLIIGRVVLFNIRTYSSGHPQRKGVLIESATISDHFIKWFNAILMDGNLSRSIGIEDCAKWKVSEKDINKLKANG
ncbi:MAG: hypothetical protein ACPGUE_21245 [Marinomonas sp.]